MNFITIDNKNCVLLNHYKLIEDVYVRHVESNFTSYSLKQELFNFKPKVDSFSSKQISNSDQLKNINRKRKAKTKNDVLMKDNLYLQPFIKEIQQKYLILPKINEDISRFWEEEYEFPQFRGVNTTNEFQKTKFAKQEFIIPPKTTFFNYSIEDLPELLPELETYDLLIMDMPWQNKYIKRLHKVKSSLAYGMLDNGTLKNMPIPKLIHTNSLVVLWCTNALQHRKAIEEEFLPNWNLQMVHCLKWFKINTLGELISPPKQEGYKQPYELIYIACSKQRNLLDLQDLAKVDFIISIPSIIHSHKPPLAEWLRKFLNADNFRGIEIFARYLQPHFTSIGLEVLKLMDKRLYNSTESLF